MRSAGNRTIRRHRIVAAGSAAMAVALVATGASLLTRPNVSAAPRPATRTAATGIVVGGTAYMWGGQSEVRFNRDPSVENNVRFSVLGKDGKQLHELGVSSTGRLGQAPTAVWKSAMVEGHPITIGLVPSPARNLEVTFADGSPHGISTEELKGTGYLMFSVDYTLTEKLPPNAAGSGPVINGPKPREASRTSQIASISWSEPTGIVDGIAGDQRLTGRVLNVDKSVAVKVVLRPADGGRTTVSGQVWTQLGGGATSFVPLSVATTDPTGAAVVTGRPRPQGVYDGGPLTAGVLPRGAIEIGVDLATHKAATGLAVTQGLPDGRVFFALNADFGSSTPSKSSITAITWTNADGSQGWIAVTQNQS